MVPCKKGYSRDKETNRCRKKTSKKKPKAKADEYWETNSEGEPRLRKGKKPRTTSKTSKTSKPKTSKPKTSKPKTSKPKTSKPKTSKPKTSKKKPKAKADEYWETNSEGEPRLRKGKKPRTTSKPSKPSKKKPSEKKSKTSKPSKTSKKKPSKPSQTSKKKTSAKKTSKPSKTSKMKKVSWKDMIKSWKSGHKLPVIKSGVYWETSSVHSGGSSAYIEKRVRTSSLPMGLPANPAPFASKLKKSTPVSFLNLGKSAVLVAPPNKGLNFSHIGTFHKNASSVDIKAFWRKVATEVEKFIRKGSKVYVSTHGNGVNWLHVRIEKHPKYYASSLKKT